ADGTSCDDGDPCTSSACVSGTCTPGPSCPGTECSPSSCTALGCVSSPAPAGQPCGNSACTTGTCDGAGTCNTTPINIGGACDDGLFCTTGETCDASGQCNNGAPTCKNSTQMACFDVTCDEAGAKCVSTPLAEGSACDDGDGCTMNTTCQS